MICHSDPEPVPIDCQDLTQSRDTEFDESSCLDWLRLSGVHYVDGHRLRLEIPEDKRKGAPFDGMRDLVGKDVRYTDASDGGIDRGFGRINRETELDQRVQILLGAPYLSRHELWWTEPGRNVAQQAR